MSIAVEHFTRTYGSFTAVDDLSLHVTAGEIVGLIGPNGAGKTTTLRALAGILRPTSGTIAIGGHDIAADAIEAKRRLAFMPDEPHLFEYLTVDEHLRLTARLYAVPDFDARARALIDELELTGKERALPRAARGMRQKVDCAASCGCPVLFDDVDGPTRSASARCARRRGARAGGCVIRLVASAASGGGDLHPQDHGRGKKVADGTVAEFAPRRSRGWFEPEQIFRR
jgi:ABC-type taurine transport system ATPase subunit